MGNKEFDLDKLLVIIVLYKQKLGDSPPYIEYLKNPSPKIKWFVYDNSPELDREEKMESNVEYFHDSLNSGVSKAYNVGAEYAKLIKKEWLLLFDQDTELPSSFFLQLEKDIKNKPFSELYVMKLYKGENMISPSGYRYKRGFLLNHINIGINSIEYKTFLNSGLLLSLSLFEKVGGYDNDVPLYFSDFIFINRIRRVQKTFFLLDINLIHDLASNEMSDVEAFITRYKFYLVGAKQSIRSEPDGHIFYYVSSFLRAVKLFIKLKKLSLLVEYWNIMINGDLVAKDKIVK